jgi:pyruvate formate lyase activating enzyme
MISNCKICGQKGTFSDTLPFCPSCLREEKSKKDVISTHQKIRKSAFPHLTQKKGSHTCRICGNQCPLCEGETGFCELRKVVNSRITHLAGTPTKGLLHHYFDPLPTNCVADWVCPGGTGRGYPKYAYRKGPEYGYKNLAIFFGACSFNCLFCQNWHYRELTQKLKPLISAQELSNFLDEKTACICFFGGDPSPQMPFALKFSLLALKNKKNRILRICWETNGNFHPRFLKKIAEISLSSGGCVKFDLKAYSEKLNLALTGVSNKTTLSNFEKMAEFTLGRPEPPFLIASTLLIPGYIDLKEIKLISRFIASLNPQIPYSLLAFHPSFYFSDLPTTSKKEAEDARKTALDEGLKNVHLGNIHLLI